VEAKASRQRWSAATFASSIATVSDLPWASTADQTVPTWHEPRASIN
jgi:hypothetical protein